MWIQKKAKQGKHCIDVWHMWRLAFFLPSPARFSTTPSVCHQKSVARFSFCIFLLAARFHPLIRSFNRPFMHSVSASFIHSLTHSSHSFHSLWVSVPFWLFLSAFSWLDFYFIFISISMKATFAGTFGSFIKFSKSHLALSRLCVLFPSMYSLTIPIPPGIRRHQHRKRLFWGCAVMGLSYSSSSSALRVHFNKKKGIAKN